ncbi:hypothetical protein SSX86_002304 [Deinandra increscens subsp. villosa]|uniref:DUF1771 domain-containing protein n=1 Tax=Deinandra increscens subsp. villosa TaxID=3103831 RepID=A0AAP0DSL0_9ASTR
MEASSSSFSSSTINLSNEDVKNLEFLLEAFGSTISVADMASAYCQAGHNLHKASEILYQILGTSSNNNMHISNTQPANGADCGKTRSVRSRGSGVSVGTVSGVIGADYGRIRAKSKAKETCEVAKPVKLMSNEFPASEIWDEKKPQTVSESITETMNRDVEVFLFKMFGFDMEVIREVAGDCGYDVKESMEKLMNMSAPSLDLEDIMVDSKVRSNNQIWYTYQDLSNKFEENAQISDLSQRSKLEKEVLSNLFTVSERSEAEPKTIHQPRIRKHGLVTGPLEDQVIEFKTPIVKKEVIKDGRTCLVEDNYDTLREAVKEHWTTMKLYYRAAVDAYAKGSIELSDKLLKKGHFYMAKAREADEISTKILTETRDDGEVISINLSDYDPKEAVHLLKTQLKNISGIPSIHYLKVMVGTYDDKNKPNARKRLISKLLQRDAITWTEEQDGQIMAIRIDVINRNLLSFNK